MQRAPHLSDLAQLRFLVLDEADRMIEKNHFEDLTSILSVLPPPMPPKEVCVEGHWMGILGGNATENNGCIGLSIQLSYSWSIGT